MQCINSNGQLFSLNIPTAVSISSTELIPVEINVCLFLLAASFKKLLSTIIAEAFSKAVDGIKQRGKSDVGQKTMLDVLIPVAAKFQELASSNMSNQEIASDINQFAIDCAHNTKDMLPSKGRSSGLGERALGHIDPGAKSCQVMISAVCQHIQGE